MTTPLDGRRVDAYLARLGAPEVRCDAEGLARLQSAHLQAVPFHNLLLLANDGRPWDLPYLHEVVDDAIAGVGGNCDRTTPPFMALLRALGFDARLAGATVREPGDHFVCVVRTKDGRRLCDVGNGHPYLRPWDLDGPVQEQSFHGWRFRFDPRATKGPTLQRKLADGAFKTVYVVDPSPREYDDFAWMVREHYTRAGFGPFLTGLRAVRILADAVLSLRDTSYARDTRFGRSLRRVAGAEAARALLTRRFALPPQLVDDALGVVARRQPELLAEPRWLALGRGRIIDSVDVRAPTRADVPDVVVSFATLGCETSERRLLDSLVEEIRASHYPGRVGVLIVENHDTRAAPHDPAPGGLVVHRVAISSLRPALDRAAAAGVVPFAHEVPVPIGVARDAQLAALRAHLEVPRAGLPHPDEHPVVVWMVDDDVCFQQLVDGKAARHTHLLFRAARYWAELPQHAVVLGSCTGDPPVPGLDSLGGQLRDLTESLSRMLEAGPDASWRPFPSPSPTFDAYYDLTEMPRTNDVWPYAPHRAGEPVREIARSLLLEIPRLLDGQQLTRALEWDGSEPPPRSSVRRGGNALFLDLDAVFRWPTPALTTSDGVTTRRADTIWAALARAEDPDAVVEVTLPLLHVREGQAARRRVDVAREASAQARGFVLARAISESRCVHTELPAREARVTAQRRELVGGVAMLRAEVLNVLEWFETSHTDTVDRSLRALDELERHVAAAEPLPGDPRELDAFLARLPGAVQGWRGGW